MAAGTWMVTRQEPDTFDFRNPGSSAIGTIVYFTTGEGNDGSVFIPDNRLNPKVARELLSHAARLRDEIAALQGTY